MAEPGKHCKHQVPGSTWIARDKGEALQIILFAFLTSFPTKHPYESCSTVPRIEEEATVKSQKAAELWLKQRRTRRREHWELIRHQATSLNALLRLSRRAICQILSNQRAPEMKVWAVSKLPTGTPKKVCSRGRKTQKESVNQYCRCCKLSLRYGDTWKSLSSESRIGILLYCKQLNRHLTPSLV